MTEFEKVFDENRDLIFKYLMKYKETEADYPENIAEHVALFEAEGMARMEAIKACAKKRGVPKSVVYDAVNK